MKDFWNFYKNYYRRKMTSYVIPWCHIEYGDTFRQVSILSKNKWAIGDNFENLLKNDILMDMENSKFKLPLS